MGVPPDLDLKKVIADRSSIFAPGLGLCAKTNAHLQQRDGVKHKFLKARPLSFSGIDAVEKELQRLEDLKIFIKVVYSNCSRTKAEWQSDDLRQSDERPSIRVYTHNSTYMSTWQKVNDGVFPIEHARAR